MTGINDNEAVDDLWDALDGTPGRPWLDDAVASVRKEPASIARHFPAAGRHTGRETLPAEPGWTADQAARAVLLDALLATPGGPDQVAELYRYGDSREKLAMLTAFSILPEAPDEQVVPILRDALRTNDTRLVAAALGPVADRLDDDAWRQGVLKCVFMGVPLAGIHGLHDRGDDGLALMLAGLAEERAAAGRDFPEDAAALLTDLRRDDRAGTGQERDAAPRPGDAG
ncbi:EboA domain-containing protein [Catenuloplanes japonicus]|uniref:EboA domain-containing protein n=1 Tax=Catenuloplanes japonicus TaxID=33876 RepID=UPI0005262D94|nr:EboA domain-containing protein [Catenuloplanes japonicus]